MTPVQVFLVVVGLIIIALSYMISESFLNKRAAKQITKSEDLYNLSEGELKLIRKKVEKICDIEAERTIDQAEEKLSKISNEKIMAMSEFSDQLIEKIEQNHSEVVFLYNMLNDKEETIKERELVEHSSGTNKDTEDGNDITKEKINHTPIDYGKELNQEDIKAQELAKKQVLQLYSEGKSIIEISKLLEIGQGEIKLIIELARGINNET